MKAAVLYDRIPEDASPDHLDVLVQAKTVGEALLRLGYEPVEMGISMDFSSLAASLRELQPTLVFNLVESLECQGNLAHLVTAVLDHLAIPYTGSRTEALLLTAHKLLTKKLFRSARIPCPPAFSLQELENRSPELRGLYIIKSLWEHASWGLDEDSVIHVEGAEELAVALRNRTKILGKECFAEKYIEGREFNFSLLASKAEPEVLPAAEIIFDGYPAEKRRVVGYRAKWDEQSFEYRHTIHCLCFPPEDAPLLREMADIARECWHLFGLRGYARVDFRTDAGGKPWVLEINSNPCLAPDAGFVAAAAEAGLAMVDIVRRIISDSMPCDIPGVESN